MTLSEFKALLDSQSDAHVKTDFSAEVEDSVRYLSSAEARASLECDCYWPKWDSPWWHMVVLHEMGLSYLIPEQAVEAMVEALCRLPAKFFPIHPHEVEPGWDLVWDSTCHCAAGSIYSVLSTTARVDVDEQLPWLRTWLSGYQMSDGGMSCDPGAYRVADECPGSMVGLIPAFEALLRQARDLSAGKRRFLDRGGSFLIGRQLRRGSSSEYNAEERQEAVKWLQPCFPRLYFYDVLRGLHALLSWCQVRERRVPLEAVTEVVAYLCALAPDGKIRCQRLSYAGTGTRLPQASRGPVVRSAASPFPLLEATSRVGEVSPFLTAQWTECKRLLRTLTVDANSPEVKLVPANPDWQAQGQEEAERFGSLLGDNLIQVHHIGSTAIPGISAKPVIDLAPEVHDLTALDGIQEKIEAAGYEYWGEYGLPGRRFCPRSEPGLGRVANVHCYGAGDSELVRLLAFRNYMRAHPARTAEYESEKLRARDLFPYDTFGYNDEKNAWIRQAEADALGWYLALE